MTITRLVWDHVNVPHITGKHDVTPQEVEEAVAGDTIAYEGKKGRLVVIGATLAHRVLAVMLDPEPEPGVYYVATARPASRKERQLYTQQKGGDEYDDAA